MQMVFSEQLEDQRWGEDAAQDRQDELEEVDSMAEIILEAGYILVEAGELRDVENNKLDRQLAATNSIIWDTPDEAWESHVNGDKGAVFEITLRRLPMVRKQVCIECGSSDIDTRPLVARHDEEETVNLWKCARCSHVSESTRAVFVPEGVEVVCAY